MKKKLLLFALCVLTTTCASYQSYDRTYSGYYEDAEGRKIGGSIALHPPSPK